MSDIEDIDKLSLKELHERAYKSIDRFDNYNYGDELVHWQPVAKKDKEFEKQIAKLKAMKEFNRR